MAGMPIGERVAVVETKVDGLTSDVLRVEKKVDAIAETVGATKTIWTGAKALVPFVALALSIAATVASRGGT